MSGQLSKEAVSSEEGEVSSFSEADNQDLIKQIDQARKLKQQHSGHYKDTIKSTDHEKPHYKIKRITVESALIRRNQQRKLLLKDTQPETSNSSKKSRKDKKSREKSLNKEAKAAKESVRKDQFRKNSKSQQRMSEQRGKKDPSEAKKKNTTCPLFLQQKCFKGDKCPFSHSLKDVPANKLTQFPGQGLCKYFVTGGCWKGDKCSFSHDTKKFPCKKFHAVGSCQWGDLCKYSHRRLNPEEIHSFMIIYKEYLEELYRTQGFTNLGEYYLIFRQQQNSQNKNKFEGVESLLPEALKHTIPPRPAMPLQPPINPQGQFMPQATGPTGALPPPMPMQMMFNQAGSSFPFFVNQSAPRPQYPSSNAVPPSMVQNMSGLPQRQAGYQPLAALALLQGRGGEQASLLSEKQEQSRTEVFSKKEVPPPPPVPAMKVEAVKETKVEVVEDSRRNDPRVKLMRRLEEGKKNTETKSKLEPKIQDMLQKLKPKSPPPPEQKPKSRFARVREKMAEKAKEPAKSGVDLLKEKGLI